ncbi:MAG: tetratricopeptide repeat protein, partial [Nannocystaceae bacterium]|nr:tetratricopeptide repeat protein [Nannocystaceae bacterium]
ATAAGATAIAGVWAWPQPPARRDAAARLAAVWSPARAQALANHFAGTAVAHAPDTWQRTQAAIDRYTASWQRAQQDLCTAIAQAEPDARRDDAELDARAQCLGQRLHALGEWIDVLATADAELVDRAVVATVALPRPEGCIDAARPGTPTDPRLRERIDAVDRALQRAHVLENAGRYTTAVETADAALRDAAEIADPPLQARAQYAIGSALEQVGEIDRARDHLREALWRASAVGDDVLVADAGTELVWIDGLDAPDLERALEWSRHVGAALARRPDVARQARLANALGATYSGAGRPREAAEQFARALALFEQAAALEAEARPADEGSPESPDVATAQMNLGITVAELGRLAEGRELLERAQAMYAEIEGPDHPDVANVMDALGGVALRMGDYDAAREQFGEALRRRERALPAGHVAIARSHNSLGSLHEAAGDDVAAEQAYRRALDDFVATLGPEHPFVGATLANLGSTMCRAGRWEQARDHATRGLALLQRALPPEHPWIAAAQLTLVRTALGRGDIDDAARERDAIVAACAPTEVDPALCAVLDSTGAAIAHARGEPHAAARLERARASLRALGLQASRDVAELERWLAPRATPLPPTP